MIIIIPIEKVDGEVLDYLRYKLEEVFNMKFKIAESIKVLGVTEWDIYVGGMNFIFGLANFGYPAKIRGICKPVRI